MPKVNKDIIITIDRISEGWVWCVKDTRKRLTLMTGTADEKGKALRNARAAMSWQVPAQVIVSGEPVGGELGGATARDPI